MRRRCSMVWLLVGAMALSGCSTLREASKETEARIEEVGRSIEAFRERYRSSGSSFQIEEEGIWLGADAVRRISGGSFPIEIAVREDYELTVAAGPPDGDSKRVLRIAVAEVLGLRVLIDPVTLAVAGESVAPVSAEGGERGDARLVYPGAGALRGDGEEDAIPRPPGEGSGLFLGTVESVYDEALERDFVFSGTAAGLLDAAVVAMGLLSWRFDGKTVWLSGHEMREFPLHVAQGMGGGEEDSGSRLKEALSLLRASCGGCKVESLPSLGVVQVRAFPQLMPSIERLVGDLNRRLTEQFAVEVSIYQVTRSLSEGLDLTFGLTFGLERDGEVQPYSESDRVRILPREVYSHEGVVRGLSEVGNTVEVFSSTVVVLSGQTQVLRDVSTKHVAVGTKQSTGEQGNVGDTVEDIIKELNEGFELGMRVQSLGHGRVLLGYEFTRSSATDSGDDGDGAGVKAKENSLELKNTLFVSVGDALLFTAFERDRVEFDPGGNFSIGSKEIDVSARVQAERLVETYVVSLRALEVAPSPSGDQVFRTGV